jgi:hypothetical protein
MIEVKIIQLRLVNIPDYTKVDKDIKLACKGTIHEQLFDSDNLPTLR